MIVLEWEFQDDPLSIIETIVMMEVMQVFLHHRDWQKRCICYNDLGVLLDDHRDRSRVKDDWCNVLLFRTSLIVTTVSSYENYYRFNLMPLECFNVTGMHIFHNSDILRALHYKFARYLTEKVTQALLIYCHRSLIRNY